MDAFPSPAELWARFRAWKGLTPEAEAIVLQDYYHDGSGKAPRYYQVNAVNAAIEAIAKGQERISSRDPRPVEGDSVRGPAAMTDAAMNAGRLLALYNKVAEAPDAIARLRRFVLDLAVRGKLVAQDPADEPASELLKRIAAARDKTLKAGRSVTKKLVDPSLAELSFALPSGWSHARLSDLVRVANGRAYKKPELLDEGTPVLRVGNLFTSDHWYYSNLELEDDKYCDKGDLIYAWSASFGPFIWDGPRVIYHYHIWKLPLFREDDLDKQFLYLFLLQKTREIKDAGHGISMVHMTKEKMEQLAVPLPPLAEQQTQLQSKTVASFQSLIWL